MRTFAARRRIGGLLFAAVAALGGSAAAVLGACGPFSDVTDPPFCNFILEIFYLGITTGTTPATYDPTGNVTRIQMAAFLSRTVDGVLKRGSRRAASSSLWTAQSVSALNTTTVGGTPRFVQFDGGDLWVANQAGTVSRVRASDARLLETWTGGSSPFGLVVALNRVLVADQTNPGRLLMIDPSQPAGVMTEVANNLGALPTAIAFDGARVWAANQGPAGSISIVTPGLSIPWTVTTISVGVGATSPLGALYDGGNVWITDLGLGTLLKLDSSGAVLQTVTVGPLPFFPAFDGNNLWVPLHLSNAVAVVRASNGAILQVLTGNGLTLPSHAGFDGERVLVTNFTGDSVSLWKAADLSPLGTIGTGASTSPQGVASDGTHFWVGLASAAKLVRF